MLYDVVHRKSAAAGSLDGWCWKELKVLPVSWFDELARIFTLVEDTGIWPDGLFDAYITMIHSSWGDNLGVVRHVGRLLDGYRGAFGMLVVCLVVVVVLSLLS